MAFSKKHLYPITDQKLSEYCKAIGYPGRIEILRTLHYRGKITAQEILANHPITEETLSDHLSILRKAGLIAAEERFPYTFYSIREGTLQQAILLIESFLSIFQHKNVPDR